jgi:very-short-patch-repair endonuclease
MHLQGLLRRQHGVLTLAQAAEAGLPAHAVRARVRAGHWQRLRRGVLLASALPPDDEALLRAAVLCHGEYAAASGLAAGWWHGLVDDLRWPVEITVPRSRAPGRQPGIRLRRRDLAPADLVELRHLWTTAFPLTVLESAIHLGADGPALLDRALQRRVSFPTVVRAHHRNLGRHGSTRAGDLLVAAADRAASHAERRLLALLRANRITGWRRHYWLSGYELDVAFPSERVAIEVDGWAWHSDAARFAADRRRQNTVVLAGWTVLRFTWHDLTSRPDAVVAEIRRALTT